MRQAPVCQASPKRSVQAHAIRTAQGFDRAHQCGGPPSLARPLDGPDPHQPLRTLGLPERLRHRHDGPRAGPSDEEFSADFNNVFARWRAAVVARLEPLGIAPGRVEALSRAARSTEPFNTTTEALISATDHDAASHRPLPDARAPATS